MLKYLWILSIVLLGCNQPSPQDKVDSEDVFDVMPGRDMHQISSTQLSNGWLYTLTNGGIPINDPHLTKWLITVEMQGKHTPTRLKTLFPKNCQELKYTYTKENEYPTWIDMLSCSKYNNDGILVVTKAIQGESTFFGATLYRIIPTCTNKVKSYKDLQLSNADKHMIERFIKETKLSKKK